MAEIWKDIVGFEGYYQVSNLGNVKRIAHYSNYKGNSLRFLPERIKSQYSDKYGYKIVLLNKDQYRKLCKVHRLVAEAFIDNPNNFPVVNHKDENPSNNEVHNLEWCTVSYNCNYGTRNNRMSETKRKLHKCYCKCRDVKGRFSRVTEKEVKNDK